MSNGFRAASDNSGLRLHEVGTRPTQHNGEQNEAVQQSWHSEKLAELNLLAGSLGHELRNALAVVTTAVEVLGKDYAGNGERGQIFKEIARRLDSARQLAGNLVDYSKPLAPKKVLVRLIDVLDAVVGSLTRDSRLRCITVVKQYRSDPVLRADPDLLERLFLNLTLNAVEAMKFSGELTIQVVDDSKNVSIAFIDRGCGMEKAVQDRVFGPFFSTKADGSGLGLLLCKKYVEAHEGSIAVKTEAGLGSTFTVLLPGTPSTRTGHPGR